MRKWILIAAFSMMPIEAMAADAHHLVKMEAKRQGVPVSFALRVARVESGVKCGRTGTAGEKGPLQILPRSAAGLGYRNIGKAGCATQTRAGMKHLAVCWRGANGNAARAAACHNGGFGMLKRKWPKSVKAYVRKVSR